MQYNNFNGKLAVLIHMYDFIETAYINIQMLREGGFDGKIYLFIANDSIVDHKRLKDISSLDVVYDIRPTGKDMGRSGTHLSIVECVKNYLSNYNDSLYVLFTFEDNWVLDFVMLQNQISKMLDGGYDGLNFITSVGDYECLGTNFFILKAKYLNIISTNPVFAYNTQRELELGGPWEYHFYSYMRHLNWLCPMESGIRYEQYGYRKELGSGHFTSAEEKLHFIKLWEKLYNKKLDYNLPMLLREVALDVRIQGNWVFNPIETLLDNTASPRVLPVMPYSQIDAFWKWIRVQEENYIKKHGGVN